MEITVRKIADDLGGSVQGDSGQAVSGISDLANASDTDISFILSEKNVKEAETSKAAAILSDSADSISGKTVIKVKNAKVAYVALIHIFHPQKRPPAGISPKAIIAENVKLGRNVSVCACAVIKDGSVVGDNTVICEGTFIGSGCVIGSNTCIYPNVSIHDHSVIGDHTIIHSGAVIGGDGFAYFQDEGRIVKVPQIGNVRIGNNVEIGSNVTVDRAAFSSTVIEDHVKIDNLVQVAHNCVVGQGTILAAQVGMAGSAKFGKYCLAGGQSGVSDHVKIGDFSQLGGRAGVLKDLPPKSVVTGTPARPFKEQRKKDAYLSKLGKLFKKVKDLESEIETLKRKGH